MKYCVIAFAAALAASAVYAEAAGNAAAGKQAYNRCVMCHSVDKSGSNRLGPKLFGVMGRPAGTLPGYAYSRPLKNSKIVWTDDKLRAWIVNPARMVPGNRMVFAGISNPKQQDDLIAYMHTLK